MEILSEVNQLKYGENERLVGDGFVRMVRKLGSSGEQQQQERRTMWIGGVCIVSRVQSSSTVLTESEDETHVVRVHT